ncbi:MAG: TetR/AcrR family transcriptional regulator [bacterium]|nr:TetR/AcrR family transcriptional regulator [bacterium]
MSRQKSVTKTAYHHGDLSRNLLEEAIAMVRQDGLDALSMRKLAERVGVSQTAIYHHFSDKQALFCAMGEEGIQRFSALLQEGLAGEATLEQRFERFVSIYVRFALANPELYELLFGRTTWKGEGEASETFRGKARAAFRSYAEIIMDLQADGYFSSDINPLRLAQVMWGTLHGLCRMYNDGLAFTPEDVEEISQYARGLLQRLHARKGTPP